MELCETVPQIHGMPGPVSVGSRVSRVAVSLISVILGSWLTQATNASAQAAHWTSNGPQGGTINSIAIDPRTPDTLYVGTGSGVFRSADGGVSWTALSLAGVVYALAIDPLTPATLYAGTDSGLFKSINAGSSWNSMSSGLPAASRVSALAIDPGTPTTLYAAAAPGIFKSTNAGATSNAASNGIPPAGMFGPTFVQVLAIDPVTPTTLYATAFYEGIFKSTDGGGTWSAINTDSSSIQVPALVIDPLTPTTLYAGTALGEVLKSTNGGQNWAISAHLPCVIEALAIDASITETLYAGNAGCFGSSIFKTTDGGGNWADISTGLTGKVYVGRLAIDPSRPAAVYAGTNSGMFKTLNGGGTWTSSNTGLSNSLINALAMNPLLSTSIYAGTEDQGIFVSTDGGRSWSPSNAGLTDLHIRSIAIDPGVSTTIYAATTGGVFRSRDGGKTWSVINSGLTATVGGIPNQNPIPTALAVNPLTTATLYVGTEYGGVFQSTDGGDNWKAVNLGLPPSNIAFVTIDRLTPTTIYAGTISGVFKSTDAGASWLAAGLSNMDPRAVAIDPLTSSTVYAGTFGGGVFKSTNGASSWSGTNVGLSNMNIRALAIDPETPTNLYAGTSGGGVFRSTDGGASWRADNDGMTGLIVTGLAVSPTSSPVYAGTYGGGVFSNAVTAITPAILTTPSVLHFVATKVSPAQGLSVVTAPQGVSVTFKGSPSAWTATADQPWVQIVFGSGNGPGSFLVSIDASSVGASTNASVSAIITVTAAGQTSTILPVQLMVTTQPSGPPVGVVDTPTEGTTGVTGSIPVTGWALDDSGVLSVKIYRNCLPGIDNPLTCQIVVGNSVVFIGDATFVAGARPDVESIHITYPAAYRAGWGYLLLTNMLPHVTAPTNPNGGGQGPLTLFAYATDLEGHTVLLGQRSITLDNDHAAKPFGGIDTPTQGGTASGLVQNYGWALTPGSAMIPTDGSTLTVVVDGVVLGTVNYNLCRDASPAPAAPGGCHDDVATLFPTMTNVENGGGAIGVFALDTATLADGLHTIAWGVTDNQNRTDGIGSRYFNVFNNLSSFKTSGTALQTATATTSASASSAQNVLGTPSASLGAAGDLAWRSASNADIVGRAGFDVVAPLESIHADVDGVRHVRLPELGRIELRLGDETTAGYLNANGTLRALPTGSQLDTATGVFTWVPGPGFIGTYNLVFLSGTTRVPVAVTIVAKPGETTGLMRGWIDLPAARATVAGTFTIAGWAIDTRAWQGSGVGAVHVWAQRRDVAAAPEIFLGPAVVGGARPDVAGIYGDQFDRAGWTVSASGLARGTYDVTAYFWSTRTDRFEDARTTTVTVR